jgi:hypothetical protein
MLSAALSSLLAGGWMAAGGFGKPAGGAGPAPGMLFGAALGGGPQPFAAPAASTSTASSSTFGSWAAPQQPAALAGGTLFGSPAPGRFGDVPASPLGGFTPAPAAPTAAGTPPFAAAAAGAGPGSGEVAGEAELAAFRAAAFTLGQVGGCVAAQAGHARAHGWQAPGRLGASKSRAAALTAVLWRARPEPRWRPLSRADRLARDLPPRAVRRRSPRRLRRPRCAERPCTAVAACVGSCAARGCWRHVRNSGARGVVWERRVHGLSLSMREARLFTEHDCTASVANRTISASACADTGPGSRAWEFEDACPGPSSKRNCATKAGAHDACIRGGRQPLASVPHSRDTMSATCSGPRTGKAARPCHCLCPDEQGSAGRSAAAVNRTTCVMSEPSLACLCLTTADLLQNSMRYAWPLFSLPWLWSSSMVHVHAWKANAVPAASRHT